MWCEDSKLPGRLFYAMRTIGIPRLKLLWSLGLGVWSFGIVDARADSVILRPSADTMLHEYFPDNNLGAQVHFNAGTTQNGPRTHGLVQFDISGALPAGATINSVSLTLEVVGQSVDGDAPSNFGLHRMLVGWGEGLGSGNPPFLGRAALPGEANWTHRFAQSPLMWAAPGGMAGVDFIAAFSSDTFVYGVNLSPYVFGSTTMLVSDVQGWLDRPDSNFGWMLLTQSESEIFSARRFGSRQTSQWSADRRDAISRASREYSNYARPRGAASRR